MSDKTISAFIEENFGTNATYVEGLLARYQANPRSVDESWQEYFSDLLNGAPATQGDGQPTDQPTAAQPAAKAESGTALTAQPKTPPARWEKSSPALCRADASGGPITTGRQLSSRTWREPDGSDGDLHPQHPGQSPRRKPPHHQ